MRFGWRARFRLCPAQSCCVCSLVPRKDDHAQPRTPKGIMAAVARLLLLVHAALLRAAAPSADRCATFTRGALLWGAGRLGQRCAAFSASVVCVPSTQSETHLKVLLRHQRSYE